MSSQIYYYKDIVNKAKITRRLHKRYNPCARIINIAGEESSDEDAGHAEQRVQDIASRNFNVLEHSPVAFAASSITLNDNFIYPIEKTLEDYYNSWCAQPQTESHYHRYHWDEATSYDCVPLQDAGMSDKQFLFDWCNQLVYAYNYHVLKWLYEYEQAYLDYYDAVDTTDGDYIRRVGCFKPTKEINAALLQLFLSSNNNVNDAAIVFY